MRKINGMPHWASRAMSHETQGYVIAFLTDQSSTSKKCAEW
jgi:hypothetical protein